MLSKFCCIGNDGFKTRTGKILNLNHSCHSEACTPAQEKSQVQIAATPSCILFMLYSVYAMAATQTRQGGAQPPTVCKAAHKTPTAYLGVSPGS